jgi:sRNA-binding carbon storage regulator CsrA
MPHLRTSEPDRNAESGFLVIKRNAQEEMVLTFGDIVVRVKVAEIGRQGGQWARIAVKAPKSVLIHRGEVYDAEMRDREREIKEKNRRQSSPGSS